ncbi:MAG: hypothetical protein ACTSX9_07890 [Candidatus Njordarchaeales archaeon]
MITFLVDGINTSWHFPEVVKQLSSNDVVIIHVPSFDFKLDPGFHFSPGLSSVFSALGRRHFRTTYRVSNILNALNIIGRRLTDFDSVLMFLLTIWIEKEWSLTQLYDKIREALKIKYRILPLLDPPSTTMIETKHRMIDPLSYMAFDGEEIRRIKFFSEDSEVTEAAKEAIEDSSRIVLYETSLLTMLFIREISSVKKVLEKHKGEIICILPHRLTKLDKALLARGKFSQDILGAIESLQEQVDIITFDSKEVGVIEKAPELKLTLFPISYGIESLENRKKTLKEILNVIIGTKGEE